MNWFAGGVSICGSRHTNNQDHMAYHHIMDGWLLTVSDGLGSKKRSQKGSEAVCSAAWSCACQSDPNDIFQDPEGYMRRVHCAWLRELEGEQIDNCCATVLILLVVPGKALAMQLGDGFIAVFADNNIEVLLDDKSDHYINETDCFQEIFTPEPLRYKVIDFDTFQGALICSDGVEIGDMTKKDVAGFTKNFSESFSAMSPGEVKYQVNQWLSGWPGTDDKTAVYLLNEGALQ